MPKCSQCDEIYADQLRRCPNCGESQDAHVTQRTVVRDGDGLTVVDSVQDAELAEPEEQGNAEVAPVTQAARKMTRSRLAIYLAVLLVVGGAGVVFVGPSKDLEPVLATPAIQRTIPRLGKEPPLPDGVRPGSIEKGLEITQARLEGGEVVVVGTCGPKTVVHVLVAGKPAVLSPQGDTFMARVAGGEAEVEVVGLGVGGKEVRRKARVTAAAAGDEPAKTIPVTSHAEGQTVHTRDVELEFSSTSDKAEVQLARIENRIPVGKGHYVLFRAPAGLVYLRTADTGHYAFLRERDGAEMILLPAGVSRRGMTKEPPHGPQHIIRVAAHLMDRTEVTCARYAVFLQHMRRLDDPSLRHPEDPGVDFRPARWEEDVCPAGWRERPVTGVNWYAAFAYARWVGGRLPTEAEWERGAAGPLGLPYPWGEEFDWALCNANAPAPVAAASRPGGASHYGLLHMSGNAREWCEDRFDPRWYLRSSRTNPRGPSRNKHRVVRGGSHASSPETLRAQHRDSVDPMHKLTDVGFRVVMRWVAFKRKSDD